MHIAQARAHASPNSGHLSSQASPRPPPHLSANPMSLPLGEPITHALPSPLLKARPQTIMGVHTVLVKMQIPGPDPQNQDPGSRPWHYGTTQAGLWEPQPEQEQGSGPGARFWAWCEAEEWKGLRVLGHLYRSPRGKNPPIRVSFYQPHREKIMPDQSIALDTLPEKSQGGQSLGWTLS